MNKLLLVIFLSFTAVSISAINSNAAVSIPWTTTYDCPAWDYDDEEESDPNEVTTDDSDDKTSEDESDADDEPKEISGPDDDSRKPRKTK